MKQTIKTTLLIHYDGEVIKMMSDKYGLDAMDAFRRFLSSETYQMLADDELEMWDFSPAALFDMWESESVTGDPRTSLFLRRD